MEWTIGVTSRRCVALQAVRQRSAKGFAGVIYHDLLPGFLKPLFASTKACHLMRGECRDAPERLSFLCFLHRAVRVLAVDLDERRVSFDHERLCEAADQQQVVGLSVRSISVSSFLVHLLLLCSLVCSFNALLFFVTYLWVIVHAYV